VLADDLELIDLDIAHLRGWLELLVPPPLRAAPSWVLVLCEGGDSALALASSRGAIEPVDIHFGGTSRPALARARAAAGADILVAMETGALSRIAADAEARLALGDHYTAQALSWLDAFRARLHRDIWIDPPLADLIPPLSADALQRTFDLLVPDDSSLVAYVIADDRRSIAASAIAVKRGGRMATASSHQAIAGELPGPALARRWRTEYRGALDRIASRFAEPSAAMFAERAAIRRVLSGPADQLGRELAARNIIIDPMPRWLAALLGGASAAAMAQRGARVLGAWVPKGARRAAAGLAAEAGRQLQGRGMHPWQVLGFDPIDLWKKLRRYYRE
jgi:hypothetical protein